MASRIAGDLSYGHLGEASYDTINQKWTFTRDLSGYALEQVQSLDLQLPGIKPLGNIVSDSVRTIQLRRAQEAWVQKHYPEIGPAGNLTSVLAEASDTQDRLDETNSSLLAVGRIAVGSVDSGSQEMILARPFGDAGNIVELLIPGSKQLGWNGHSDPQLELLDLQESIKGYWRGSHDPIRQLEFSPVKSPESLLLVRQSTQITILRLVCKPNRTANDVHATPELNNQIEVMELARLSMQDDKEQMIVHATFQTWKKSQIAVINQAGQWSLYKIKPSTSDLISTHFQLLSSGSIYDYLEHDADRLSPSINQWGRVLWAVDTSSLLVANRRHLRLLNLACDKPIIENLQILGDGSPHWIVDIQKVASKPDQLFVLTTSRVLWLRIKYDEVAARYHAETLISVEHYRHPDDLRMRLEVVPEREACSVFLLSTHLPTALAFRFYLTPDDRPRCSMISTPLNYGSTPPSSKPINMRIFRRPLLLEDDAHISGPGKEYSDRKIRFFEVLMLYQNQSIYQSLFAAGLPSSAGTQISSSLGIELPAVTDRFFTGLEQDVDVEDDFVVPDVITNIASHELLQSEPFFDSSNALFVKQQNRRTGSGLDARKLYEIAFGNGSKHQATAAELGAILEDTIIGRIGTDPVTTATLHQLSALQNYTGDIDETSELLQNLSEQVRRFGGVDEKSVRLTHIEPSILSQSVQSDHSNLPSLDRVYDHLIDMFVTSLPRNTSGPTRLAKERLIRKIATELCLSSIRLDVRNNTNDGPAKESALIPSYQLPIRRNVPEPWQSPTKATSTYGSSQPFLASSSIPQSSMPETPRASGQAITEVKAESAAVQRLRAFSPTIRTQSTLSTSKATVLAHWPSTPGSDPALYSWGATRHAIAKQQVGLTEEEERRQARRKRRAERQSLRVGFTPMSQFKDRNKQAERETSPSDRWATQPLSRLVFGSQPDTPRSVLASSSQAVVDDMPMTQPALGLFGSREGKQGKKKKRKAAGFR